VYCDEIKTKPTSLRWLNAEIFLSERKIEGAEQGVLVPFSFFQFLFFFYNHMIIV